ncbi:hypothetical protein WMY93_000711 [Mugilogobius chulae]|uniref:LRRCT domain-containing protein n=1 Tax=Mugilogobius chulae TaxID=88201 RepID=A0AAW0Q1M9_9GOBI
MYYRLDPDLIISSQRFDARKLVLELRVCAWSEDLQSTPGLVPRGPCRHAGLSTEMLLQRESSVLWLLLVWAGVTGATGACICPDAPAVLSLPLSTAPPGGCCLNLSGSALGLVNWGWFSNFSGLEILDLSHCNITHIHQGTADTGPLSLTTLFLNHNSLRFLPRMLLSSMFNLTELHLEENHLEQLPPDFLLDSNQIHKLNLRQNKLSLCQPPGESGEVCSPTRLTALFIALPLLFLSALVLCWCCGRTNSKDPPAFSAKKKNHSNHTNCLKQLSKPPPASDSTQDLKPTESILQNQLLLRPCSALLSSTRDIHQETLEVRLGSVDSLPRDQGSLCSSRTESRAEECPGAELDTVSVTESTKYYSLVPGLQLDDSDHGEFDNVDLT